MEGRADALALTLRKQSSGDRVIVIAIRFPARSRRLLQVMQRRAREIAPTTTIVGICIVRTELPQLPGDGDPRGSKTATPAQPFRADC